MVAHLSERAPDTPGDRSLQKLPAGRETKSWPIFSSSESEEEKEQTERPGARRSARARASGSQNLAAVPGRADDRRTAASLANSLERRSRRATEAERLAPGPTGVTAAWSSSPVRMR